MNWSVPVENLLARYADEAQVRSELHRKSFYYHKKTLNWFQLPIIIGSALSGSLQFLSKSFPEIESHVITCTASLSIVVSLLSAVMSFLKIPENATKNEMSLCEWQNFYSTISHQLALARTEREDPEEFMAWVKQSYKRLFEISPIVSKRFITQTKKKIRKVANELFQTPNYLNGIDHTKIWRDDEEFEDNSV